MTIQKKGSNIKSKPTKKGSIMIEDTQEPIVESAPTVATVEANTIVANEPAPLVDVKKTSKLQAEIEYIESELEKLGSIKSLFHVQEIKTKLKSLISEFKTKL